MTCNATRLLRNKSLNFVKYFCYWGWWYVISGLGRGLNLGPIKCCQNACRERAFPKAKHNYVPLDQVLLDHTLFFTCENIEKHL